MRHEFGQTKPDIKQMQTWVNESKWVASEWRRDSWADQEMYDGGKAQWTQKDWDDAIDAGISPLTINRTFPSVNLILGNQVLNKYNIMAKARTHKDSEISQTMTEALRFVSDQNNGEFLVTSAFENAVIPGFGCIEVGINPDPRKEKVSWDYRNWMEIWWDPFGNPWLDTNTCRYAYHQRWVDLSDLQATFWEKRKEIEDMFHEAGCSIENSEYESLFDDEANYVEEYKRTVSGSEWVDTFRRRVRPVRMWYTVWDKALFASFADGRVIELKEDMPPQEQFAIIQNCQEVVKAVIRRMRVATFFSDLLLDDMETPHPHDEFPYIPFIGYIDRFGMPYGVPRQIRDQDVEINKRRSMALALLKSRRVIAEKGVSEEGEEGLAALHDEANKLDSFIVVEEGKIDKIRIAEKAELARTQVDLLHESEREVEQISGSNAESLGHESNATSGVAIARRTQQSTTVTSRLFDNLRRSQKKLGELSVAMVQGHWHGEKVLRITDRLSGADRFVTLNQKQVEGGVVKVKNNITQGRFDCVVSEAPMTDTVREQNLQLIIEWVKKSPPEIIPQLLGLAFEMSNLPNKEQLLARIRPILGINPGEEDMSPDEIKQKTMAELEAQREQQTRVQNAQNVAMEAEAEGKVLDNMKTRAEIAAIRGKIVTEKAKVSNDIVSKSETRDIERLRLLQKSNEADQKVAMEVNKAALDADKSKQEAKKPQKGEGG